MTDEKNNRFHIKVGANFDLKKSFELANKLIEQKKKDAREIGWNQIDDPSPIWDQFYNKFGFNPSTMPEDWPSILEPSPSVTFEISHFYRRSEREFDEAKNVLEVFYLETFRCAVNKGENIVALDWQHPCYKFDPIRKFDDWPIPALPNGDYYIFLTENMTNGFFGHPWEKTICVFGHKFVDFLQGAPDILLSNRVRVDGIPVD